MPEILYHTKSVCPHCLRELPAVVEERDRRIFMGKSCPEHGAFHTLIWDDEAENYLHWLTCGGLDVNAFPGTPEEAMLLCLPTGRALAVPCSAALMVTNRCNNHCPICFTRDVDETGYEPSLDELLDLLRSHAVEARGMPLELCGGEPTVRDDLPELAREAQNLGFDYIQLNTNGIRLARQPEYCRQLALNGVTTAYLGFDGFSPAFYVKKYGQDLLDIKKRALANCAEAGLAIVLACCVVPGGNEKDLGKIIRLAKENMPWVKGVFFQPLSYFGSYPQKEMPRLTIPTLLRRLAEQTEGEISMDHFIPGRCEHAQCSFGAFYQMDRNGRLCGVTRTGKSSRAANAHLRVRDAIKRTWKRVSSRTLTVGGMAFMDAWNLDALRLSLCTVQIIGRNGSLTPLCGKYLTADNGKRLHPHIS